MSNVKISALPAGTIAGTDTVPVVKAGVTTAVSFSHTHPQSDVTSLVTDLAAKASQSALNTLQATVTSLQNSTQVLTPLDQSTWAWTNQGSAAVTQGSNVVQLSLPSDASDNVRGRFVTAPTTTPYTFTALVVPNIMFWLNYNIMGIGFRESGSGKIVQLALRSDVTNTLQANVRRWTNASLFASETKFSFTGYGKVYLRIGDNGTNNTYEISTDGVNFTTVISETRATGFTTKPDQVGIVGQNLGTGVTIGMSYLSWVQG